MVTPWIQNEGEATIGSSSKLPCDRQLDKPYRTYGNFENIRKEKWESRKAIISSQRKAILVIQAQYTILIEVVEINKVLIS